MVASMLVTMQLHEGMSLLRYASCCAIFRTQQTLSIHTPGALQLAALLTCAPSDLGPPLSLLLTLSDT